MESRIKRGKTMNQKAFSLISTYKITIKIAGSKAKELKKSYFLYLLSYIMQGLTFALFYPLLNTIFTNNFNLNDAIFWIGTIIILSAISLFFKWGALNFNYTDDLTEVTHNLRLKLGNKIKSMPLQKLNKYRTGELNSILAQNVDDSVLHMGIVAGMGLEAVVVPLVIIIATFFININLALTMLIAFPISIPIYKWSRKLTKKEKTNNTIAHSTLEADTLEYLQGLFVLKSVNQVGKNSIKLQKSISNVRKVQKKGAISAIFPLVAMNSLIELVFLLILILGSFWITNGNLTIAALISLLIIINRISEPISNFLAIVSVLDIMKVAFDNIEKILVEKDLKTNQPTTIPEKFNINFNNVTFNYLNCKNKALDKVSFNINSNSLTALVGNSGSGKTTITKLIMRYDDPSTGNVEIGNVNIKNIKQNNLMKLISVVFQDVYLFDDTILNNIRMGNPKAKDEEVMAAASKAHCHNFISKLPNGYQTKVGEIGGNLSGGEKQRISIARAILKNTPIVILDEPTSALDTESEIAVQKALDELIKNKTVIVIAHKLSTISHANNILVVDNGKILETGNHNELINLKGKYYQMYKAQNRTKHWDL